MIKYSGHIVIFIVTLLTVGLVYIVEAEEPEKQSAAVVNGVQIPISDLDREIQTAMAQDPELRSGGDISALRKMRKEALDDLIDKELVAQEGKKAGFEARDIEIDTEIAKIKQRFPSQDAFLQTLKQSKLTENKLREIIRMALIRKKVLDIKVKPLAKPVTDEDIAAFYQENKQLFQEVQASHILLKVAPDADAKTKADAKEEMQGILEKARNGADFAELAKEYSQCPSSLKGGDLGFFPRGQMVKPFEDAAFSLEKGQISEIVETQFGYHIIMAVDTKPKTQTDLDKVHETIRKVLYEKEVGAALKKWLEPVREKADIKILFKG